MAINYRQPIGDLVIADLKTLTHINGTSKVFGDVVPLVIDVPTKRPICEVFPISLNIDIAGMEDDTRLYGYSIVVYDSIGAAPSNASGKAMMDNISAVEDMVLRHFERIPITLEHALPGIQIFNSSISSGSMSIVDMKEGTGVALQMTLILSVKIQTKLL